MKPQKILSSQSDLEKKEQNWSFHALSLQTILQRYSNQNNMVLAKKQTWINGTKQTAQK